MKKVLFIILILTMVMISSLNVTFAASPTEEADVIKEYKHQIEVFPIVAFFKVYSIQYVYELFPKDHLIVGLAYVNPKVYNQQGEEVGQYFAPTIPVGYRRYLWRNLFLEYQLWPAYDFYYEKTEDRFYAGFDLYSELRTGYRFDIDFGEVPIFINLQYVYGIGLYPGNKPESFKKAVENSPAFHMPAVSIGVKF